MKTRKTTAAAAAAALALLCCACGAPTQTPQHTHDLALVPAEPATCEASGTKEHYKCGDCNAIFADALGNTPTTEEELGVAPIPHPYGEVFKFNETEHWQVCVACGAKSDKEKHEWTHVDAKPATKTQDGYKAGDVCLDCGRGQNGGAVIPKTTPFTAKERDGLKYCAYEPTDVKTFSSPVPLILFLHGSDERGSDNEAQLKNAICEVVKQGEKNFFMNSVVLVPQCPDGMQWADTPWTNVNYKLSEVPESDIAKKTVAIVKEYIEKSYVDPSRVIVMGVSMGGFGAWDMLARHSDVFTAGVPICGGGPIDAVDTLKTLPIFTYHSDNDTAVPYEGTRLLTQAIRDAGGDKIKFTTYSEGHVIWDKAIKDEELHEWLAAL